MYKPIFILVLFLLFATGNEVFAQKSYLTYKDAALPKKALENYEKARSYLSDEKPKKAIDCLEKAIKDAPNFIDAKILLADSYYTLNDYDRAGSELGEVLRLDSLYMPKVLFILGNYAEKNKKYLQAARYFERYAALATAESKKSPASESVLDRIEKAKLLAAHNRFRDYGYAHPVPFEAKNLGDAVNSSFAEYTPCISVDGKTLLFTRLVGKQEDFYCSKKDSASNWLPAFDIGKPVNTDDNEGAQTLSADGKTLIYTACNRKEGFGSCDLLISEYKNGAWTSPETIGAPINSKAWESQPALSANGRLLIFSTSRKDGKNGGKNLFQSKRGTDGKWSEPVAISELNTPYDEVTPFLHPDGQTLYFSSNGHPGFGDNDLFVSRLEPTGKWGKPQNFGYPINTEKVESGMIVTLDGKTAIFAAEFNDTRGKLDLYSFELPIALRPRAVTYLKATVKDAVSGKKMAGVTATLKDLATSTEVAQAKTDDKGEFLLCLPLGINYSLAVAEKKYAFYSDNFNLLENNSLDKPYSLKIDLQPLVAKTETVPVTNNSSPVAAKTTVLKNVFFNTASAELKPESRDELMRLRDMLTDNPSLKIQLNGHTDNKGGTAANQTLSENRANAVRTFLIQNGVAADRITARGFGESQPIDSNDTETGRKNNRRTEFFILN